MELTTTTVFPLSKTITPETKKLVGIAPGIFSKKRAMVVVSQTRRSFMPAMALM
jgi:hypothetical protein